MNKVIILFGVALLTCCFVVFNNDEQLNDQLDSSIKYAQYKLKFNKKYGSAGEASYRQQVYQLNMLEAEIHNSNPDNTWLMGETQFSDLTKEEFIALYLIQWTPTEIVGIEVYEDKEFNSNGIAVDWRTKPGVATHVKNQGACGSCWAFSTVTSVEAFLAVQTGQKDLDLSEQQLVDCSKGNSGCHGGEAPVAMQYVAEHGLMSQKDYPYLATDNECKIEKGTYKVKGPKKVNPDTNSHKSALLAHPFSIAIDARNWSQYTSGVFNNCGTEANHAVNAFGFDKENNWIVKNSWGTSWGEGGFIRLAPGNTCNFLGLSYIAS